MNILVAGDFCPQNRVASLFEKGEFADVLKDVKKIMHKADYRIVNFECPVCKGGETPIEKCGPNLKCTKNGIEAIKWAGFDCVTLANNHFLDFGYDGVKNTLEACREYSLDTVGGGLNLNDAEKILYKEIGDRKIAIINCCEHEFSIATNTTAGSNPLNIIKQYYGIIEAKQNADYVLVIVHGGHEHFQLPSPRMKETYRFFIDVGADAVVNHHQHCFSGYESYKGKPIFYGLGNLCFDGNRSGKHIWNEGFMVLLTFGDKVSFKLIPYTQCENKPEVYLLSEDAYSSSIEVLNAIIEDADSLNEKTQSYYKSVANSISNIFEPFYSKLFVAFKRRGFLPSFISRKRRTLAFDLISCESHRDKLISFLSDY